MPTGRRRKTTGVSKRNQQLRFSYTSIRQTNSFYFPNLDPNISIMKHLFQFALLMTMVLFANTALAQKDKSEPKQEVSKESKSDNSSKSIESQLVEIGVAKDKLKLAETGLKKAMLEMGDDPDSYTMSSGLRGYFKSQVGLDDKQTDQVVKMAINMAKEDDGHSIEKGDFNTVLRERLESAGVPREKMDETIKGVQNSMNKEINKGESRYRMDSETIMYFKNEVGLTSEQIKAINEVIIDLRNQASKPAKK